ncbi:MAG: cobalamin biosynthesis protein CbiD [Oscillospiraceae bacterium]|nr:cobalamin biosynthesis protein CbiD [Oscillospiraceae bacterium]MDD6855881.1 cobalt-precorrin-5B (C(1))-methyltransferase CbiD [Oscillospiraceae bacterium]
MEEFVVKEGKRLRLGYTTGSCAAAAAKAAAWMLLTGREKTAVTLHTPKGMDLSLSVQDIRREEGAVSCAIVKDGGDDPDITAGALIYARVSRIPERDVEIDGGFGVGRVTKPGLDQKPGQAAINSVPRKMIRENLLEVAAALDYTGGFRVEISVPLGEELAKKTFNPRLGIVGGISILGTTGIVEPMSEQALLDTIRVELRQKRTQSDFVLLTPGNYGSDFIRDSLGIDPRNAVQVSNFIGDALDMCKELDFRGAVLIGHIGKLVKLGGGMMNTHSKYGDCRTEILSAMAGAEGVEAAVISRMLDCVSCDECLHLLEPTGKREAVLNRLLDRIHFHLRSRAGEDFQIECAMFSKEYGLLGKTAGAEEAMEKIFGR